MGVSLPCSRAGTVCMKMDCWDEAGKTSTPEFTGGALFSCEPSLGFSQLRGNVLINEFNLFTYFFHFACLLLSNKRFFFLGSAGNGFAAHHGKG